MGAHAHPCVSQARSLLGKAGIDIQALDRDRSIIYALLPDLRIGYCNAAWDRFAKANGGEHLVGDRILGKPYAAFLPDPVATYYLGELLTARCRGGAWEHEYDCSSPAVERRFRLRALPLPGGLILMENSQRVDRAWEPGTGTADPVGAHYCTASGTVTVCAHCKRTQRVTPGDQDQWDWVPAHVALRYPRISHGLCPVCVEYYYAPELRRPGGTSAQ
jgi:hypothetical protein